MGAPLSSRRKRPVEEPEEEDLAPVTDLTLTGDAGHYATLARAIDRDLANGPIGRDENDLDFLRSIARESWRMARGLRIADER